MKECDTFDMLNINTKWK